eukprot:849344-Prorocentrum_minimum.AAC.1
MPPPYTPLAPDPEICPLPACHRWLPLRSDARSAHAIDSRCGQTFVLFAPLAPAAGGCSSRSPRVIGSRR